MKEQPTDLFTILKLQNQEIGEFYAVPERRAPDFEASKLRKGRSGASQTRERLRRLSLPMLLHLSTQCMQQVV